MICYRLAKARYMDSLDGYGAALRGGRWNGVGVKVVYTASSRALAMAEMLVHLDMEDVPDDYHMMSIEVPDDVGRHTISPNQLPVHWNKMIEFLRLTKSMGNDFIRDKKYGVLIVPSAVVKGDVNILINPTQPSFSKIKIIGTEPFPFDHRLFC